MSALAPVMSASDAERITTRITLMAGTIREGVEKLHQLVQQAKDGNAHVALGYPSWTAYLADVLGKQPIRLDATERRELVAYLSGEGMSTRAIAPIVGVTHKTVVKDTQVVPEVPPGVNRVTGEITETTGVTGLDGKTYERPAPKASTPRRAPLHESARNTGWELDRVVTRLAAIASDDRLPERKNEVAAQLRSHLDHAIEVCQDLLDRFDHN
jgi:hypothetical protein